MSGAAPAAAAALLGGVGRQQHRTRPGEAEEAVERADDAGVNGRNMV
ncbi:MAG TPA: hypothetical protein VGD08_17115 [Stellaceae bacterium]